MSAREGVRGEVISISFEIYFELLQRKIKNKNKRISNYNRMYVKIIAKSSCATCTTRFQINLGLEKQKKIMFNKVGGEKIFSSGIKKKTSGMK